MDERDLTEDEAVARLRAADPAADAEPDTVALRRQVDAGIAEAPVDEVAVRRERRWTSWPARLAGVAAATLVVGAGAGYAVGSAGSDDGAPTADPAMTLQDAAGGGGRGPLPGPEADENLATEGMAADGMSGADAAYWPGYWGRVVFTASGLSDAGGELEAYTFDAAEGFSEQAAADLAAALGVEGTPELVDGAWTVGPTDGSTPMVQIWADGTAGASYFDPTKDPWRCDWATVEQDARSAEELDPSVDTGASEPVEPELMAPEPVQPCEEQDLGPAPKGEAAIAVVRDALAAIGADTDAFEFTIADYGDDMWTYVTADLVVDGQRSGLSWSASLTGAGLQSMTGPMAPLVSIGAYDVISPVAAVERLSDPRFGAGSGGPIAWTDGAGDEPAIMRDAPAPGTVPDPVGSGASIEWPVQRVTIVDSRLALALHTQADGAALLVPTYELIGDDGAIWSVIAVTEEHLDFAMPR